MNKYRVIIICCCVVFAITGCKKDHVDYKYPQPYDGQIVALPGVAGNEAGYYAANSVFVDFSKGIVTPLRRTGWDLGFFPGTDNKAIINHSTGALVAKLENRSLTSIVEADTTTLATTMQLQVAGSLSYVDPMTGDAPSYLSKLQILNIAATEDASPVYIFNPGMAGISPLSIITTTAPIQTPVIRAWYKAKIYQGTNGYRIKYGLIRDPGPVYTEYTVNKNLAYNFNYFSFTSSIANAEPPKSLWDIEWTWTTYPSVDAATIGLPAPTQDFVLINFLAGVTAAQLKIDLTVADPSKTRTYENFTSANLTDKDVVFLATRDAIGTKWRSLSPLPGNAVPPIQVPTVDKSLFYIIKDAEGNYYKLRFNTSSNIDGGVQGRPVIEYKLVQPAPNPGNQV